METSPTQHKTPDGPQEQWLSRVQSPMWAGVLALALILFSCVIALFAYGASLPGTEGETASAAAAFDPFADIALEARGAIVVDLKTKKTLYALHPDAQLPLASLTKIPLVLVVSEVLPLDAIITIPRDTSPPGSAERLAAGEKWQVKDIVNFTLVASSNGGAQILADAAEAGVRVRYPQAPADPPTGGVTLWRMNELARELGLAHTYFLNVSGLDLSATQSGAYGSPRDMATLFSYAASSSSIFEGTAENDMLLTSASGREKTSAFNTNKALGAIPGLIFGKTGLTDLAGGNLAVVFDVGPAHPVVAVVLGSTENGRFDDMRKIVEAARAAVAQE